MALKWLKIDPKYMRNVKNININLYYNFSPRFLKTYFSTGGAFRPPCRVTYEHSTQNIAHSSYKIYIYLHMNGKSILYEYKSSCLHKNVVLLTQMVHYRLCDGNFTIASSINITSALESYCSLLSHRSHPII